jgi:hypothetical protein
VADQSSSLRVKQAAFLEMLTPWEGRGGMVAMAGMGAKLNWSQLAAM